MIFKCPLPITTLSVALSVEILLSLSLPTLAKAQSSPTDSGDRSSTAEVKTLWSSPSTPASITNSIVSQGISDNPTSSNQQIENTRWNQFTAPGGRGVPGRREGGGTRGPSLTALVPQTLMGLTVSARPTFFYYVSTPLKNSTVEFELADDADNAVYKTTFNLETPAGGVFNITIPDTPSSPVLEVGKTYRLYVSIKNSDGSFLDFVSGWVKRVELPPTQMTEIQQANAESSLKIYEQEAIWYDTLATLAELRQSNPGDTNLQLKWDQLLKEVQLDQIAQQPLLQSQLAPGK